MTDSPDTPGAPAPEPTFRRLAPETWLTVDPVFEIWVTSARDLTDLQPFSPEEWVARVSQPMMGAAVPEPVVEAFEAARSAMAYGAFSYPLLALASEQLTRVSELAAKERCKQLGHAGPRTFQGALKYLENAGELTGRDLVRWDATRALRNHGSHPKGQMLIGPPDASHQLSWTVESINRLFSGAAEEA